MYAHYNVQDKNKWVNHRIHRKYNNIHRASRRGESSRSGKKCQRVTGKAAAKQMESEYNDFVLPSASRSSKQSNVNIQAMYNRYYNDADFDDDAHAHQSHPEQHIDGVLVSIDFYQYREEQTEYDLIQIARQQQEQREREQRRQRQERERQRQRLQAYQRQNNNAYRWSWNNYIPSTQQQENDELQLAIAVSLQEQYLVPDFVDAVRAEGEQKDDQEDEEEEKEEKKCKAEEVEKVYVVRNMQKVTVTVSVWGHNARKYFPTHVTHHKGQDELHVDIASKAWHTYQNNVPCRLNMREHHLWRRAEWKIMESSKSAQQGRLDLMHVLDACAPYLYQVYHVLFDYLGYHYLMVSNVKVKLLIADAKQRGSWKESGITYVDPVPYDARRRYADYTEDVLSYVPSYIYYKRNANDKNKFCEFGEYDKKDWKVLTYYASKR